MRCIVFMRAVWVCCMGLLFLPIFASARVLAQPDERPADSPAVEPGLEARVIDPASASIGP